MLEAQVPGGPSARAGLEMALFRAWSQATGASLWERWGAATDRVETDITLSMVEDVADRAVEAAGRGFSIFKIKVGSHRPGLDLARLKEVHGALPQARFRLDANQAFGADEALRFLDAALSAGLPIDLLEQPVSKGDLRALDEVARRSAVPIFADEAVLGPRDALRLLRQTAVRGVNVKLMKCGIAGALRIIQIAQEEQRELMIGCMLETRQGVLASLELACGTDAFRYVDLDSHLLLDEAGENPWFHQEGPALILRPPLTLEPDRQVSSAHPPPDPGRRGLE
jgi:L-alanine-DL-glutamate epimerase-like enolase superfamily enzyme